MQAIGADAMAMLQNYTWPGNVRELENAIQRAIILAPGTMIRPEDLPLLTRHFIQKFAQQYGRKIRGVTPRARLVLERHSWPGNVRELENAVGHACMMAEGEEIDVADLPTSILSEEAGRAAPSAVVPAASEQPDGSLADHERRLVFNALEQANGNQSEAARALGIGRDALRYKMKKYGLL